MIIEAGACEDLIRPWLWVTFDMMRVFRSESYTERAAEALFFKDFPLCLSFRFLHIQTAFSLPPFPFICLSYPCWLPS